MSKRFFNIVLALVTLLIASCLMPEKFLLEIDIDGNGNVTYTYNGTIADVRILMGLAESGQPTAEEEKEIQAYFEELRTYPGIKKYTYMDIGRAKVVMTEMNSSGVGIGSMQWVSFERANGQVLYTQSSFYEYISELNKINFKINGKISITSDLPILSQSGLPANASKKTARGKTTVTYTISNETMQEANTTILFGKK